MISAKYWLKSGIPGDALRSNFSLYDRGIDVSIVLVTFFRRLWWHWTVFSAPKLQSPITPCCNAFITHSLTHPLTLTHLLTHPLTLAAGRRQWSETFREEGFQKAFLTAHTPAPMKIINWWWISDDLMMNKSRIYSWSRQRCFGSSNGYVDHDLNIVGRPLFWLLPFPATFK